MERVLEPRPRWGREKAWLWVPLPARWEVALEAPVWVPSSGVEMGRLHVRA